MKDLFHQLHHYAEQHSSKPPDYLQQLERETYLKTIAPQMISGHLQGRFLALISQLLQPKQVLEIGTFTAYGALCMAEGLAPDGILHTIEIDREREPMIRQYLHKAQKEKQIHLHIGDALDIVPTLPGIFDLIFIDAGKQDYLTYYEAVIERVRPGGLLLADNVFWWGKVLAPEQDADALHLHQFNQYVQADTRVQNLILPLRDGLMVVRKL